MKMIETKVEKAFENVFHLHELVKNFMRNHDETMNAIKVYIAYHQDNQKQIVELKEENADLKNYVDELLAKIQDLNNAIIDLNHLYGILQK